AIERTIAELTAARKRYQMQPADQPKGKGRPPLAEKGQMQVEEKPLRGQGTPPPANTDRERMVGSWVIVNEDSGRKGEIWDISLDEITMHVNELMRSLNEYGLPIIIQYFHRLDASKNPEQIDIRVTKTNLEPVGVIKGIYALEDGELRLCLGTLGKDRPAAFPDKPKPGEVLVLQRGLGATPPKAEPPAKTVRERMVGNWFIMNEDSGRKGEMWVIDEDSIVMHAKETSPITRHYAYRLNVSKNPKQIDIIVSRVNGPPVGVIKGIYVLDKDELRLCLGEMDKHRPEALPEQPKPGELLILQRASSGATPPKAKDALAEQGVLTPEEAIQQMPKEKVTVQFKVAKVEAMHNPGSGFGGPTYYIYLSDSGKFTARMAKTSDQIMKLGIDPVKHFTGRVVRVTGVVEAGAGSSIQMWVREITDIEVMDRAF
ncbi:MAG TPA: TIGR03067 domain-containing protein, partial [Gemmataceae bacterium]|nr:TIGR03067 domain-containing protein [Gemmataceae bacterium]